MEDKACLEKFASNVRALRESLGISQEKLAELSGVHRTYIGMIERAERNPSLICMCKIAKGLGVSPKDLI